MPIYKLIKQYPGCPNEWTDGMLFVKDQHKLQYRPINKMHSSVYVDSSFVEEADSKYWSKHEVSDDIFSEGANLIIIPKKFKKGFAEIIYRGLRDSNASNELKNFLQQYVNQNINNDFPGSTKL